LSRLTISAPPFAVRVTIWSIWSLGIRSGRGIPATVEYLGRGTIVSPWPPSTKAVTFSTETLSASAMNQRMRAESSTPAMPMTRSFGRPECFIATWHIASSGFETTIRIGFDEYFMI
jgi:hypothetical protein